MSDKNKKLLFQGVAVLFLVVAAMRTVNWLQGDQNALISVIINLLLAAGLYYRSLNPIPSKKKKNSSRRED